MMCPVMHAGTPIQNCMEEVFSIINLMNPGAYATLEDFTRVFGGGRTHKVPPTAEQIGKLKVRNRQQFF